MHSRARAQKSCALASLLRPRQLYEPPFSNGDRHRAEFRGNAPIPEDRGFARGNGTAWANARPQVASKKMQTSQELHEPNRQPSHWSAAGPAASVIRTAAHAADEPAKPERHGHCGVRPGFDVLRRNSSSGAACS